MPPKSIKSKKVQSSAGREEETDKDQGQRKRWTENEKTRIAEYILEAHQDGKYDRKDIKNFIEKMRSKLGFECTYKQIRNCYEKLEIKYKFVNDWLAKTGSGLQETDPGSIEAFLKKHCPQYKVLEEVWGTRNDINPPVVYDSGLMTIHEFSLPEFNPSVFEDDDEEDNLLATAGQPNLNEDFNEEQLSREPININTIEDVRPTTPPSTLKQSAESFHRTLKHSVGSKRKRITESFDDLDYYVKKRVEVDEKRLDQENNHQQMQISVEENKLEFQKEQFAIKKMQFEDKEKNRLVMKIMEMQEKRDLELLKLGKDPDLTYSQKLMTVYGLNQASQSASPSSSSSAGPFSADKSTSQGSDSNNML